MTTAVNWHSQSDVPQQAARLCCWAKRDFFREKNYIVILTIQFLPFLLRLNEGSGVAMMKNFVMAKTVLYIRAQQHP